MFCRQLFPCANLIWFTSPTLFFFRINSIFKSEEQQKLKIDMNLDINIDVDSVCTNVVGRVKEIYSKDILKHLLQINTS